MGPARPRLTRAAAASAVLHGGAVAALLCFGHVARLAEAPVPLSVQLAYAPSAAAPPLAAAEPAPEPEASAPAEPPTSPEPAPLPEAEAAAPLPAAPPVPPREPARPARQHPATARAVAQPPAPAAPMVAVEGPPPGPAVSGPPAAASAGPSTAWLSALDHWIDAHLAYPEESRRRGEQGAVLVRFTVARDGRLLAFALVRGSGYDELDDATRDMFRNAHLPAAPLASDPSEATLSKPVRYVLR